MTVPVVWWSAHPDALRRGYWDQALLEALLDGTLWRVPGAPDFAHVEMSAGDRLVDGGAVVVVPARHNVTHVDELRAFLDCLDWALVVCTGDEAAEFPWAQIAAPNRRIWGMGALPHRHDGVDVPLGSGWPPHLRATFDGWDPPGRGLPWAFLGQVTHARRCECARVLGSLDDGFLLETEGFTHGVQQASYWATLAHAKVPPCPSGPESPDSFRLYEALELGCVPLADAATPHEAMPAYWEFVFGEPVPFPLIHSWDSAPEVIRQELAAWPANANRIFAWWQGWKRALAWRLHDTLIELAGDMTYVSRGEPDDDITVIVTSSPTALHPLTEHLDVVLASIRDQLPTAEVIVCFDGVRPEQEHLRGDYEEYQRRALWSLNHQHRNVVPLRFETHTHQAAMTRAALEQVRTPLILFVEHDTPIYGDVPWRRLGRLIRAGNANVVRLAHESSILEPHRHLMLDKRPAERRGEPCVRTVQWSQRPHLASTGFYRRMIAQYFGVDARTMIEDVMHGVVQAAWRRYGDVGWEEFRVVLYAPDGDMKRSWHLDSRGDDPKYDMHFAYDGPTPDGAPRPTEGSLP